MDADNSVGSTESDVHEPEEPNRSGGAVGCFAGFGILIIPIVMMELSPAEGSMGWTGAMILPFTTVLGGIIGIAGLVAISRAQDKTSGDK